MPSFRTHVFFFCVGKKFKKHCYWIHIITDYVIRSICYIVTDYLKVLLISGYVIRSKITDDYEILLKVLEAFVIFLQSINNYWRCYIVTDMHTSTCDTVTDS